MKRGYYAGSGRSSSTMSAPSLPLGVIVLLVLLASRHGVAGIQCYSCKGAGPNEVEANIRCLESAYLENCDDFYQYYSEVENSKVLSYEYYYYDGDKADGDEDEYADGDEDDDYYDGEGESDGGDVKKSAKKGKSAKKKNADDDDDEYYDDYDENDDDDEEEDDDYYYDDYDSRRKRDVAGKYSQSVNDPMDSIVGGIVTKERSRRKRNTKSTKKIKNKKEVRKDDTEDVEYDYEYEEIDEYDDDDYDEDEKNTTGSGTTPSSADANPKPSPTMPKDPEHFCYSATRKNKWESYTVEKGCKKIMYCKDNAANLPEWSKPWNFCCDKARCNAKLVKDKPQRIFGMGCRRTDDCIQGYNSRPVCPNFFQSCPKISSGNIKMECRIKSKTMASVKNAARFQHMFREKKCYCSKGYFPRGPICTSGSSVLRYVTILLPASLWIVYVLV